MKKMTALLLGLLLSSGFTRDLNSFIRQPDLESGVYFKTAWIGDNQATLFALPTVYSFAMSERIGVDAATTPALAYSNFDNSSIVRLSNTKFRLSCNLKNLLLLTAGARVPTGFNQYSGEQLLTSGSLAARSLAFRYSNLMSALDLSAGASSGLVFRDVGDGDLSMGLGLSYLFRGAFQPQESDDRAFDPGDEVSASVALEYAFLAFDRRNRIFADLGTTFYGDDTYGDRESISPGSKFNWALQASTFLAPRWPLSFRLANFRKGANENPERFGETTKKASDLLVILTSGLPFRSAGNPFVRLTFGSYAGGGSMASDNEATVFTLSGGADTRLSEHLFGSAEAGVDMGTLNDEGVLGVECQVKVNWRY